MTTIGHLHRDGADFVGRLETLTLDKDLRLVPATKFSVRAPDFDIKVGAAEAGAAWRVSDTSGAVLSLKLDDPSWPEPINVRAMASEDGELPLVWIRRIDPPAAAAPGPAPG
ncbi:DUF736 domain-containing protein [Caulobacter endophyticus]|uniref:DUF736 domain-containing protein n=1 Tax=Caulobacter endophyticus TaxID=2172652 RepID=A0A2T9JEF9_9CAUL|nr:DUF736 domain-containing protein [Caulobacter endophyticus]PVM82080.1 DUF736 domain-containing protein [Caulobacter endophyticus]